MVKVAVLGFGFMGKTHADAYVGLPNCRLVDVGDVRSELFQGWKVPYDVRFHTDLDHLLQATDADVVDICLPTFLHEEFVTRAAARGLHILCEKPLALGLAEADRMLDAVRKAGVTFMVAQVVRFFAHYARARDMVRDGTLGNVFFASAARLAAPPRWARWFRDPAKSGGALFDLHIHDLDYLLWLFGAPASVYATGVQSDGGCWDQVVNTLSYADKKLVIEASYRMPAGWPFATSLRLVGEQAALEYQFRVQGNVDAMDRAQHSFVLYPNDRPPQAIEISDPDPYLREVQYFVDCVDRGEAPALITPEESRMTIAVAEAALHSLTSGQVVNFASSREVAR